MTEKKNSGFTEPMKSIKSELPEIPDAPAEPPGSGDEKYKALFTHLRRTNKALKQRLQQQAVELDEVRDEARRFASVISHDLRAPLVNLQGFVEELEATRSRALPLVRELSPEVESGKREQLVSMLERSIPDTLAFIRSAAQHMEHLLNVVASLLHVSQIDLRPEPIDTAALVQDVVQSLRHQIDQKGIQVKLKTLPRVVADRTALDLILSNLLSNAVKFLEPKRPGEIEIWALQQGEGVVFSVRDNGCGMDAKGAEHAFEMFRRLGPELPQGAGVGLAYVRTMVRRCGGRVWCESELGKGSTFRFILPQPVASYETP